MGDVTDIRPTEKVATWLAALLAHESVTRLQAAAGQTLIHVDHVPSGVYVVLSGDLALSTTSDAADAWAVTADRPYLLPHPAELDSPAGCAARVRTTVDLIHVPRSLMWLAPEIGHLLQHAPIPAVSLTSCEPTEAHHAGKPATVSVLAEATSLASRPKATAQVPSLFPATQTPTRAIPTDSNSLSTK